MTADRSPRSEVGILRADDLNIFMVMEAISSVALSHDEDCGCTACRAALGDETSVAQILADLTYSVPAPGFTATSTSGGASPEGNDGGTGAGT